MSLSLATDPQAFGLKAAHPGVALPIFASDSQAFGLKSTGTSVHSYSHSWAQRTTAAHKSWDVDMEESTKWYKWRTVRVVVEDFDFDDDENPFYKEIKEDDRIAFDNDEDEEDAPDYIDVDDPNAIDIDNDEDHNTPAPVYYPMDVDEPPKRRALGFLTRIRRVTFGIFSAIIRKAVKHSCAKPPALKRLLIMV